MEDNRTEFTFTYGQRMPLTASYSSIKILGISLTSLKDADANIQAQANTLAKDRPYVVAYEAVLKTDTNTYTRVATVYIR